MNYRLTPVGKMVGLTIFFFYWASMTSQSGLLLFLVGLVLGCFVVNIAKSRKVILNLEISPPKSTGVEEGGKVGDPWHILNKNIGPAGMIKIFGKNQVWIRLSQMAAGEIAKSVPNVTHAKRGVYGFEDTTLGCAYPFGLIEVRKKLSLPGELVVYPAIYPTHPPRAAGYDLTVGGKHKGIRHSTSGADFAGVRPIQHGDPLKQIHWRSSAKGQGLMVKIFEEELSGRISVLIDTRNGVDEKIFDNALRAAGSIMNAALEEGNHVEWMDLNDLQLHLVPPLSDGMDLLYGLARIQPGKSATSAKQLDQALEQISRKSTVHLFLTSWDESLLRVLEEPRWQRRSFTLYFPSGSSVPKLDSISVVFYEDKQLLPAL